MTTITDLETLAREALARAEPWPCPYCDRNDQEHNSMCTAPKSDVPALANAVLELCERLCESERSRKNLNQGMASLGDILWPLVTKHRQRSESAEEDSAH